MQLVPTWSMLRARDHALAEQQSLQSRCKSCQQDMLLVRKMCTNMGAGEVLQTVPSLLTICIERLAFYLGLDHLFKLPGELARQCTWSMCTPHD